MLRWHLDHDIDLAREVVAVRPGPGLTDWNLIAANRETAWPEDPQRHPKDLCLRLKDGTYLIYFYENVLIKRYPLKLT